MFVNLRGRVENMPLAATSPLNPLFEAIVNSIQAIGPRGKAGRIDVTVERDDTNPQLRGLDAKSIALDPVRTLRVVDNGVGFTDENMNSFETSDSRHKADVGGKGVGRLLWLKAFDEVQIESVYEQAGKWHRRTFEFSLKGEEGITPPHGKVVVLEKSEVKTTVTLAGMVHPYAKTCPKGLETIAEKIIDHCLSYFLTDACPQIWISDGRDKLDLNDLFDRDADKKSIKRESLSVRGEQFDLVHVRRRVLRAEHRIHLCANGREVTAENLSGFIPVLPRHFTDDDGHEFDWSTFVYGRALDQTVNAERGDFSIPSKDPKPGLLPADYLTKEALLYAVAGAAHRELLPFLVPIRKSTEEKIRNFAQRNPQYNHVLKYRPGVVERVSPEATDEKMDAVLHEAAFGIEREAKGRFEDLLKVGVKSKEDFAAKRIELEGQINEIGKGKLAQYVLHRRLVLDLLDTTTAALKETEKKGGEKYAVEEAVHEIIFPPKTTSHEVPHDAQNLWIIDEKLTYHLYLASDMKFDSMKTIESESEDRPDLIVFNPAHAFWPGETPFSSIVIIEFKRPVRKEYTDKENPISQVYRYIKKITSGKAVDREGRHISVPKELPFYCYIISDLTPKMREFAEGATFTPAPGGDGYFGFNPNLRAYVEVVSYGKLIEDAKKRNRVLFEKLQLPSTIR